MNENFGDWYREADFQPEHETLAKRWAGIEKLTVSLNDSEIVGLGRLFFGLTDSGATRETVKDAMLGADNAFSPKNITEIKLLSGVCLLEIAEKKSDKLGQIAAYAAVCPTLLGRRSNIFVPLIPQRANELLNAASGRLRQHSTPKKPLPLKLTDEVAKIQETEGANNFSQAGPHVRAALEKLSAGIATVSERTSRLEREQALFREDSNILWWMTGGYSRDLDEPLKEIGLPSAAILVGKELADLVHTQPGPISANAVLSRCLEGLGGDPTEKITLTAAVNNLPAAWKRKCFTEDGNRDALSLCPVAAAVRQSVAIDGTWGSAAQSLTGVAGSTKLSAKELAYQMYRECMFRKLL